MLRLVDANTALGQKFSDIIDVRSPLEFVEDHIPGAVSLPVLDDAERARVGTMHKQVSPFEARKVGAGLVSANIARHLESYLADKPPSYRPLLYCWRGGQRSNSFAIVLHEVGWHVSVLEGGYKSYRRHVMESLGVLPSRFSFRVLCGFTGSGKTDILKALAARGEQVLDLEALANHQGSLLGEPVEGQNVGQKKFETRLWKALSSMDIQRPVWTEAESAKIGRVFCPKSLLQKLRSSVRVEVYAEMDERVRYLNARYEHWHQDPKGLASKLDRLTKRHGKREIQSWKEMILRGDWAGFVEAVLTEHYDPSYRTAGEETASAPQLSLSVQNLLTGGADEAADRLLSLHRSLKTVE